MARGVTTTASQATTIEKNVHKKRYRSKVPLKPKTAFAMTEHHRKHSGSSQSLMVRSTAFTTIPRAMRARIEHAMVPPAPKKASAAKNATNNFAGNQPLARSNSGKVALGPWSGPFGSGGASEQEVPVLYLDRAGSAHMSLSDGVVDDVMEAHPVESRARKALSTAPKQAGQLTALPKGHASTILKTHGREMMVLQSKPVIKGDVLSKNFGKRGHGKNRVAGVINQPRKS